MPFTCGLERHSCLARVFQPTCEGRSVSVWHSLSARSISSVCKIHQLCLQDPSASQQNQTQQANLLLSTHQFNSAQLWSELATATRQTATTCFRNIPLPGLSSKVGYRPITCFASVFSSYAGWILCSERREHHMDPKQELRPASRRP